MYEADVRDGVLRLRRVRDDRRDGGSSPPETEWLSTGHDGGRSTATAAYNVSVPDGWERTDLSGYVEERLRAADVGDHGPALLTGVTLEHARVARHGPVTVAATAGITNPAALPMDPPGGELSPGNPDSDHVGTVNLLVGTTRALEPGALANLLTVAAEAKAATLVSETGFTGTTTDAVIVGHDPAGEPEPYSGSATTVGEGTRACVREAVLASLRSWAAAGGASGDGVPESVEAAAYGVSTDVRAEVFEPVDRA